MQKIDFKKNLKHLYLPSAGNVVHIAVSITSTTLGYLR